MAAWPSGTTCSPSGTSPLVANSALLLAEDHRVRVADRRPAIRPDDVGRGRRRDDLEARDRHRPVLDRSGCAGRRTGARRRSPCWMHERHRDLAVGHVARLGDLVDDHVPGHGEEVAEHELGDRAQAGHRGAHRRPDDRLLADRRVADALGRRTAPNRPSVSLNTPPAAPTSSPMQHDATGRAPSPARCPGDRGAVGRSVTSVPATTSLRRPRPGSRARRDRARAPRAPPARPRRPWRVASASIASSVAASAPVASRRAR